MIVQHCMTKYNQSNLFLCISQTALVILLYCFVIIITSNHCLCSQCQVRGIQSRTVLQCLLTGSQNLNQYKPFFELYDCHRKTNNTYLFELPRGQCSMLATTYMMYARYRYQI